MAKLFKVIHEAFSFFSFSQIFWPSFDKKDEMYLKQKIDGVGWKIFQNLTNVKVGFGQNC